MNNQPDMRTLVLAGNGSYSNRGCEAIVRGTTTLFREQGETYRYLSTYFPSEGCRDAQQETDPAIIHRPFSLLKRHSLPWFEEQIARKVFGQPHNIKMVSRAFRQSLAEADGVLLLGGDNFSFDYPDQDVHFRLCRMAVDYKLPVAIWGASIGPFSSKPDYERWAAKELSRVSLLCVRETETQAYLAGLGLKDNVLLTADPAFHLQPIAFELPVEIEQALRQGCLGLNLSPLLQRFIPASEAGITGLKRLTELTAELIRNLLKRFSSPILLIPHVTSEVGHAGRDDYLLLRQAAQLVGEPERVFVLGSNLNTAQTKWVISQVRFFAGARTHSTIAAISAGVPTICIGYSIKAKGIVKDVYGHLDWLLKTEDLLTPAVLSDRFASLCQNEAEIRAHLAQVNPIFRQRAKAAVEKFSSLMEQN